MCGRVLSFVVLELITDRFDFFFSSGFYPPGFVRHVTLGTYLERERSLYVGRKRFRFPRVAFWGQYRSCVVRFSIASRTLLSMFAHGVELDDPHFTSFFLWTFAYFEVVMCSCCTGTWCGEFVLHLDCCIDLSVQQQTFLRVLVVFVWCLSWMFCYLMLCCGCRVLWRQTSLRLIFTCCWSMFAFLFCSWFTWLDRTVGFEMLVGTFPSFLCLFFVMRFFSFSWEVFRNVRVCAFGCMVHIVWQLLSWMLSRLSQLSRLFLGSNWPCLYVSWSLHPL